MKKNKGKRTKRERQQNKIENEKDNNTFCKFEIS